MIQSMTGFGQSESRTEAKCITAEIKTVNHRYSEIQIKMPRSYGALEERLRQHLAASLIRGKVDVYIKVERGEGFDTEMRIDKSLARMYYQAIRDLSDDLGIASDYGVAELIGLPGVMHIEEAASDMEESWKQLIVPVDAALAQVTAMRKAEGGRLAADMAKRLDDLEAQRKNLLYYASGIVENYRQRLSLRITELLGQQPVDENRIVQEVAMIADRAGVDEELVRLDSHFQQFRALLDAEEPAGRKLDFLCQEIHREINTIGAKANDLSMTKIVVEIKSELEKLREQAQNIQ